MTCDPMDSLYMNQRVSSKFERLYFYSGKDTSNRFQTRDKPFFAVVGRSGHSSDELIPRGAIVQEIFEDDVARDCQ